MGNPPAVSLLNWLIGAMKGGSFPSALGTPLNSLFGSTNSISNPYQLENGSSGRQDKGLHYQRGSPPPNTNVHSWIDSATTATRRCNPSVEYRCSDLPAVSATHTSWKTGVRVGKTKDCTTNEVVPLQTPTCILGLTQLPPQPEDAIQAWTIGS